MPSRALGVPESLFRESAFSKAASAANFRPTLEVRQGGATSALLSRRLLEVWRSGDERGAVFSTSGVASEATARLFPLISRVADATARGSDVCCGCCSGVGGFCKLLGATGAARTTGESTMVGRLKGL